MSIYHRLRTRPDGTTFRDENSWTIVVPAGAGKRLTRTFEGSRRDAERKERDLIAAVQAERWAEIDRTKQRASVTLDILAAEWIEAGMPKPGGRIRTAPQQERMKVFLKLALSWWGNRSPAGVGPRDFVVFGQYKRENARSGTGERVADLELVALHALCTWAVSQGRIPENPFTNRPTYRDASSVKHCNEAMPATDEELHRIIGRLFEAGGAPAVAGAHLLFSAMTGLRPGEPGALRWDAAGDQPGTRLTIQREGQATPIMRVQRLKGGINPAVRIHPALESFLGAWRAYTAAQWPDSPWMFPHPDLDDRPLVPFGSTADSRLNAMLAQTCRDLGLENRKPHSMRAYYVRVRRSQGIEDATIAVELGQGSGPGLVVRTYGQRIAILGGDGLFDWMPADGAPCWASLATHKIVAMPRAA